MFQKQHFEAIAAAVQRATRFCETDNQRRGVERLNNELIALFQTENGRFDRQRYERACVPGANVRKRT